MFEVLYDDAAEALAAYNLQSVGLDLGQRMALLKDIVAHTSVAQVEGLATYEYATVYSGSNGMAENTAVRIAADNPGKIATIFGTEVAQGLPLVTLITPGQAGTRRCSCR